MSGVYFNEWINKAEEDYEVAVALPCPDTRYKKLH